MLPPQCIYGFHTNLTINSCHISHKIHWLVPVMQTDCESLLWGTNWFFIYNSVPFVTELPSHAVYVINIALTDSGLACTVDINICEGKGKGKVVPLQGRCGPEGSRRFRLPDFHEIQHMKVVMSSASRTGRFYPQKSSWYSFSLGAESIPGPWRGRKEICHWKIQWHHRESIPGPSDW